MKANVKKPYKYNMHGEVTAFDMAIRRIMRFNFLLYDKPQNFDRADLFEITRRVITFFRQDLIDLDLLILRRRFEIIIAVMNFAINVTVK